MGPSSTQDQSMAGSHPPAGLSLVFEALGRQVMRVVNNLGAATIFLFKALMLIFGRKQFPAIVQQINMIGVKTVNIVALVGFFTGRGER